MATKASITKKLGRVRPPRVHITYDVETGGAIQKREIPFVVGVLADLSTQPAEDARKREVQAEFNKLQDAEKAELRREKGNELRRQERFQKLAESEQEAQIDAAIVQDIERRLFPSLRDRKFIEIDRDNFDDVIKKQKPRLAFKVDNMLSSEGGRMGVELKFERLSDFEPQNVAKQVEPLQKLLQLRSKLANLQSSLYGNDKLEGLLQDAIAQTEAQRRPASESAQSEQSADKKG